MFKMSHLPQHIIIDNKLAKLMLIMLCLTEYFEIIYNIIVATVIRLPSHSKRQIT